MYDEQQDIHRASILWTSSSTGEPGSSALLSSLFPDSSPVWHHALKDELFLWIEQRRPHVVFVDGWIAPEACRILCLRCAQTTPRCAVVLHGTYEKPEDQVNAWQWGVRAQLSKKTPLAVRRTHLEEILNTEKRNRQQWQLQRELQKEIETLQWQMEGAETFAHTVAHSLKNPLAGVLIFSELLKNDIQTKKLDSALESVDEVLGLGREMLEHINELLLLSSIHSENITLEAVDTREILRRVFDRLQPLAKEQNATWLMGTEWPHALGQFYWVEEVWWNYLSNALKFGGENPTIKLGYDVLDDGRLCFWVQDSGKGLSEEQQVQVFQPFVSFQQVKLNSHGLGLSIVKRLVEKLSGEVGVTSEPGKGSRFYFCLQPAP